MGYLSNKYNSIDNLYHDCLFLAQCKKGLYKNRSVVIRTAGRSKGNCQYFIGQNSRGKSVYMDLERMSVSVKASTDDGDYLVFSSDGYNHDFKNAGAFMYFDMWQNIILAAANAVKRDAIDIADKQ